MRENTFYSLHQDVRLEAARKALPIREHVLQENTFYERTHSIVCTRTSSLRPRARPWYAENTFYKRTHSIREHILYQDVLLEAARKALVRGVKHRKQLVLALEEDLQGLVQDLGFRIVFRVELRGLVQGIWIGNSSSLHLRKTCRVCRVWFRVQCRVQLGNSSSLRFCDDFCQ